MTRENKVWLIAALIWSAGIFPILWLWEIRLGNRHCYSLTEG